MRVEDGPLLVEGKIVKVDVEFYRDKEEYSFVGEDVRASTEDKNNEVGYSLYSSNCIYGEDVIVPDPEDLNGVSAYENLTICAGCRATINSNIEKYQQ